MSPYVDISDTTPLAAFFVFKIFLGWSFFGAGGVEAN